MKFLAQLQNPPREFTAIPFWFLNGELTAEELRRQLADFAAHGIYGVVLHPRMGLSPDITYLGERYFAHIRTAVEAAAAPGMTRPNAIASCIGLSVSSLIIQRHLLTFFCSKFRSFSAKSMSPDAQQNGP